MPKTIRRRSRRQVTEAKLRNPGTRRHDEGTPSARIAPASVGSLAVSKLAIPAPYATSIVVSSGLQGVRSRGMRSTHGGGTEPT